jgi:hypothetical protein
VRYWLDHQLARHPQADVTTQRGWIAQLRDLYLGVPDELLRHEIQRDIASALRLGAQEVAGLLGAGSVAAPARGRSSAYQQSKQAAQQKALLQGSQPLEEEFARRLLTKHEFCAQCMGLARDPDNAIASIGYLTSPPVRALFEAVLEGTPAEELPYAEEHAAFAAALLTGVEPLQDSDGQLLVRLDNSHWQRAIDSALVEYAAAEAAGDLEAMQELERRLLDLKRRIKRVSGLGVGQ